MDAFKNTLEINALQEGVTRVAEALVAMYVEVAHSPDIEPSGKAYLARALDGVKFEIFPVEYQSEEDRRAFAGIKNRYQAYKYVIHRADRWLRLHTEEPVEKIERVKTTFKYLFGIQ